VFKAQNHYFTKGKNNEENFNSGGVGRYGGGDRVRGTKQYGEQ
jgi:hypothetical protein